MQPASARQVTLILYLLTAQLLGIIARIQIAELILASGMPTTEIP